MKSVIIIWIIKFFKAHYYLFKHTFISQFDLNIKSHREKVVFFSGVADYFHLVS